MPPATTYVWALAGTKLVCGVAGCYPPPLQNAGGYELDAVSSGKTAFHVDFTNLRVYAPTTYHPPPLPPGTPGPRASRNQQVARCSILDGLSMGLSHERHGSPSSSVAFGVGRKNAHFAKTRPILRKIRTHTRVLPTSYYANTTSRVVIWPISTFLVERHFILIFIF